MDPPLPFAHPVLFPINSEKASCQQQKPTNNNTKRKVQKAIRDVKERSLEKSF
jgi:hypothetical protein